jgi:hypothetical protein
MRNLEWLVQLSIAICSVEATETARPRGVSPERKTPYCELCLSITIVTNGFDLQSLNSSSLLTASRVFPTLQSNYPHRKSTMITATALMGLTSLAPPPARICPISPRNY